MPEETVKNKKDITDEIIDFDFDKFESENGSSEDTFDSEGSYELNAYAGILDMLITSSADMLKAEGYPEPNLKIWETWGKENLSKAFDAYLPDIEGDYHPMVCGLMGISAIALCYFPVIMKFIENQKQESIEPTKQQIKPEQAHDEPEKQTSEAPATYEEPQQVKPTSTAPISEHMRTVFERLESGATIPGL